VLGALLCLSVAEVLAADAPAFGEVIFKQPDPLVQRLHDRHLPGVLPSAQLSQRWSQA
jgi:hypothetical protein